VTNTYTLFKQVFAKGNIFRSCYDWEFEYVPGEIAEVIDFDPNPLISCGPGIHVSTPFYWNQGDTLIAVEVALDDIISCQEGKLRCKRVKVLGKAI